jgi:mycothiol synthase
MEPLPAPPDPPEYTWRPQRREDIPAMIELLLAVEKADQRILVETPEDFEREFDDPWYNPETDSLLARTADGRAVAFLRTFVSPEPEEEVQAWLWFEVHPEHRGRGLEEFLIEWAGARGRQRLLAMPDGLPRSLRVGFQDTQHASIALVERHGFRPIRYFYRMRRDLGQPIPEATLPDGLTLRTFTPDMSAALKDAFNESFRDHWNFHTVSEEDWQTFFMQRSSFRPDLTLLVMDGDQIAGYSINRVSPEENAREGFNEGWIGQLGVRRPWRKRGIATALLCASMTAFKGEGLDYATLGVDAENPTGALHIYERVGFFVAKRYIQFSKPIERNGERIA